MSSRILDCLATTDALADLFSDRSILQAMLDVECALARAAADAGAIPAAAARAIGEAARAEAFDAAAIARDARASATPAIALVAVLTERVRAADPESAQYVHWSATSQDITDTAAMLLLQRARRIIEQDHDRVRAALRRLSDAHAGTLMLGRTLLQPAAPITFGLKAATWHAAADRSWQRAASAWQHARCLQFGGAAGTRAAAGTWAAPVAERLGRELELAAVPPWHADRDRIGALIAALALYTAALGKVATDVALLMQAEVAEAFEPGGGSSAMPHKRNPSGCVLVIAAARRAPGIAAAFLGGMLQEHERSAGGSQAELPSIAAAVQAAGSAAAALAAVLEGLTVDTARMRANLDATRGVIFAEHAVALLSPWCGREQARRLVGEALLATRQSSERTFPDLLRERAAAAGAPPGALADVDRPDRQVGDAEALRRQLLDAPPAGGAEYC